MQIILRSKDSIPLIGLVVAVSGLLFVVLKMPLSRFDVPYTFVSDAITKIMHIVNVAETGWLFGNDRLGYPFGFDRLDFPRFDSLNYAIMGPIAAMTGEAGIAINLYYLASFYLIAISAFWCLRRLGIDVAPALICALAFAFLPYHFAREIVHVTNGAYFLIPPAMLVLIRLAQGHIDFDTPDARRRWMFSILVVVLLTLQTPYNGFFFSVLCIVAGAIALAQRWEWRKALVVLSLLAAVGSTFLIELTPHLMHRAEHGKGGSGERASVEAQIYSMQLHQVIIPTAQHRLAFVRKKAALFNEQMNVPNTEARNQYIGVVGLVGLGMLFLTLLRSGERCAIGEEENIENSVRIAALLALAAILISISTGLGTLIAYFLTSSIRAYNRILPFLAFAAFIGGSWFLQLLFRRITNLRLRLTAIAVVATLLLFDIVPRPPAAAARDAVVADYDRTRNYFTAAEERLGKGTAVFQMPVVWYPEHPPVNRMNDYDYLKPFLLTKTLRFSAGSARQRRGYEWGRFVERQAAVDIVAQTHAMGFGAILIDAFAYQPEDLSKLTDALTQALPERPFISPDRRWWTFSLAGCCGAPVPQFEPGTKPDTFAYKFEAGAKPDTFAYKIDGNPIRFTPDGNGLLHRVAGWHNPEKWGSWASSDATLRFSLDSVPAAPLLLSLDATMMLGPNIPKRTLRVECNGRPCGEFIFTLGTSKQNLQVMLPPSSAEGASKIDVRFVVSPDATPRAAGVNNDVRQLGIGLTEMTLSAAQ